MAKSFIFNSIRIYFLVYYEAGTWFFFPDGEKDHTTIYWISTLFSWRQRYKTSTCFFMKACLLIKFYKPHWNLNQTLTWLSQCSKTLSFSLQSVWKWIQAFYFKGWCIAFCLVLALVQIAVPASLFNELFYDICKFLMPTLFSPSAGRLFWAASYS